MSRLIKYFKERIKKDKNVLIVVTGETGSGKSYVGLRLGEVLNPEQFNERRVVFTPESFMELLNSGELKKGDVVVFDEAGVGIPAKEWYEISNRIFNYVLQTFRQDNLIVIFTTPSIGFIDGDSRKLLHGVFTTLSIDYEKEENITQFHMIQHNPRFNKTYFKYRRDNGIKINPVHFKKPDEDLIERYKEKKRSFTDALNDNAEAVIRKRTSRKKKNRITDRRLKKEIMGKIDFYGHQTAGGKWRIDEYLIKSHYDKYDVNRDRARGIKRILERELNGS